jgi:hypothetical protein
MVVLASDALSYALRASAQRAENPFRLRGSGRLRPSPAPGDGLSGHPARTVVAEIRLLRAAARVGEVEAHDRAFSFGNFLPAAVAYQDRLSSHAFPPVFVVAVSEA